MSPLDPRERDLVKCEDMRIHAEKACEFLGSRSQDEFLADDLDRILPSVVWVTLFDS